MKIVQSSHGARTSSSPSVAMSSPAAKVSKPITGRAKAKLSFWITCVRSSSKRRGGVAARGTGRSTSPKWAMKFVATSIATSALACLKC
jgi:hypothetical protein